MRKSNIILLTLLVVLSNILYAQKGDSSLAFEEKIFDFGKIQEKDGLVSHTFVFKNTGNTPVIINSITSGCGCTSHDYIKSPVKPGEKGEITITYNPAYRPGFFSKEIIIQSNNKKNINRIWIKGVVIASEHPVEDDYPYTWTNGLHTNLKVLAFGSIGIGQRKDIDLKFANNTNQPMTLKFVVEGKHPDLTLTDPGTLQAKERGQITVSYTMRESSQKEIIINIYPVVNGERLPSPIQIKVKTKHTQ